VMTSMHAFILLKPIRVWSDHASMFGLRDVIFFLLMGLFLSTLITLRREGGRLPTTAMLLVVRMSSPQMGQIARSLARRSQPALRS
jgi:hypothetical protein